MRLRKPRLRSNDEYIKSPVKTTAEAAEYLRVSKEALRLWVREGKVDPSTTPGGHFRFTVSQLNELLSRDR